MKKISFGVECKKCYLCIQQIRLGSIPQFPGKWHIFHAQFSNFQTGFFRNFYKETFRRHLLRNRQVSKKGREDTPASSHFMEARETRQTKISADIHVCLPGGGFFIHRKEKGSFRSPQQMFLGKTVKILYKKDLNTNQKPSILIHLQSDNLELRYKTCSQFFSS